MDYLATRRLLRKLRVPGAIERDPLARRLRANLRTATASVAIVQIAERALRMHDPAYWAVVRRADIEGESLKALAAELYLSLRTMCRLRRSAIEAIGREVGVVLQRGAVGVSADLAAQRLVGTGRNQLARRSVGELLRAEQSFAAAVAIDPRCVDGWLGLAAVRTELGTTLMRDVAAAFAGAAVALAYAEALDPGRAGVRAARGDFLQFANGDRAGAHRAYEDALDRDATSGAALSGAMWLALGEGDALGARFCAGRAVAADPASLDARTCFGIALLAEGDSGAALVWLESVLAIEPEHFVARYYLAHALIMLQRHDRCAEHLAAIPASERSVMVDAVERYARARSGDARPAWAYVAANGTATGPARSLYARAVAYAGLGEDAAAVGELERAVKGREAFVRTLAWDPLLRTLHGHPRFGALIGQLP